MKQIITIWFKELKDNIRDRRTLMSMVIMPMVIIPLLLTGVTKLAQSQVNKNQNETVKIAVVNKESAPELNSILESSNKISLVESEDPQNDVKQKNIDLVLIIPDNFNQLVSNETSATITALQNSTNGKSSIALSRVNMVISTFNQTTYLKRFQEDKVNPKILSSVTVKTEDQSTEQERGGLILGFLLPLFIVMWSIIGGQYIAIDISAGEKERKTLEALLLTPAKRINIVFGKLLAVATAAFISVILTLTSLYVSFKYFGFSLAENQGNDSLGSLGNLSFSIDLSTLAILLAISILLVIMFSAVLLSISIFAKSFKEAQSYIGPAYMIVILPIVIANTFPGFNPPNVLFLVPAMNAVLLYKEILVGVFNNSHIIITILSLIVFSIISVLVATKIYQKETILFG